MAPISSRSKTCSRAVVHLGHQPLGLLVDQEHQAALGGHDRAVFPRSQGHDPIPGRVAGTSTGLDLCAAQPSLSCHFLSGQAVQFGHVGPAPGEHRRVLARSDIGRPRLDHLFQDGVAPRSGHHPAARGVELDGALHVAGAQFGQGLAFGVVLLADVVLQGVDGSAVAFDERAQRPTDPDRTQLTVVADEHHLGSGQTGLVEEEGDVAVGRHARFVEHHHVAGTERDPLVLDLPAQRGQGS